MINWQIFLMGQFFWFVETWYFGWNFMPKSAAETVCDGIVVLITVLSFIYPQANRSGVK